MTPLLAALVLGFSPVTVQERAMPLGKLIDLLSERLDRPLSVQAALAKEWVVVDAENADPDELLTKIAEVTYAQWEDEGSLRRLRRAPSVDRDAAQSRRRHHVEQFRLAIAQRRKETFDSPDMPAMLDIVAALPLEDLFGDIFRYGITFAEPPSPLERPFPPSVAAQVQRLMQSEEASAKVSLALCPLPPPPEGFSIGSYLKRWDAKGESEGSVNRVFYPPDDLPPSSSGKPREEFSLTEASEAIERVWNGTVLFREASPETKAAILFPERGGRLAHAWSDAVRALARSEGRMLVANLPETYEWLGMVEAGNPLRRSEIEESLAWLSTRRAGKWLILRPLFPVPLAAPRPNRKEAGRLLRKVAQGEPVSLDDAAVLMAEEGEYATAFGHWTPKLHDYHDLLTEPLQSGADLWSLPILKVLSAPIRRALAGGATLALSDLPGATQAALRERYLKRRDFANLVKADGDGFIVRPPHAVLTERDVLGLKLEAEEKTAVSILVQNPADPHNYESRRLEHVATMVDENWNPIADPGRVVKRVYSRYRPYRRRDFLLKVRFPSGYYETSTVSDIAFFPGEGFVPANRLSPWVKRLIRPDSSAH